MFPLDLDDQAGVMYTIHRFVDVCLNFDISKSRLDEIDFQTLEEDQKKLKKILQSWFYEVSHYFQYFVLTPIANKKNIKGIQRK